MKSKLDQQAQPPEDISLRNREAEEELMIFQAAVASYPERASKEPGVSFRQYLRGVLTAIGHDWKNRLKRH